MTEPQRLPELDALRGLAVLLMALYHAAFDLRFFYGWPLDVLHGKWLILARTAAILFLLIAGICFALSWECTAPPSRFRKIAGRFLILALAAALVSLATWFIAPQDFVKFGILHLFAIATLLLPLFAPFKRWNAIIGLLIILIPRYQLQIANYPLDKLSILEKLLMPVGFPYQGFSSLDYFPLLPWFGVILIGLGVGHYLYLPNINWRVKCPICPFEGLSPAGSNGNSQFHARRRLVGEGSVLNYAGRHSLAIYLIHQPLLLALLGLILGRPELI